MTSMREVLRQITSFPKTLLLVAGALLALMVLPGIPVLPTLGLMAVVGIAATHPGAFHAMRQRPVHGARATASFEIALAASCMPRSHSCERMRPA